jgi:molecular chaperone GrpE
MRLEQEDILRQFQEWLTQTNQELEQLADEPPAPAAEATSPTVGLLPLVEAFTALRHELKLQTKSARGTEEALQSALGGLDRAIEQFRTVEPRESAAADQAVRPLVESLIELDEALRRGARAVAASQRRLTEETPQRLVDSLEQRFAGLSAWQRWRAGRWQAAVLQCCRQLVAETQTPVLASLGDGYQLICARLQRMLAEHRIERLACVGQGVDPTRMRVIELVEAPGVAPETVVDELRPGYVWQGRVVRYAEVRATRAAPQVPEDAHQEPADDAPLDATFDP